MKRDWSPYKVILAFVVGSALALFVGEMAYRGLPALDGKKIFVSEVPQDRDFFPVLNDQRVYFRAYDGVIEHLRRADLAVLGNSRTQFALRSQALARLEDLTGKKAYQLAFGDDEKGEFYLSLFRKHKVWPQILVINVDDFFPAGMSRTGRAVVQESAWEARKNLIEERAGWKVRRRLHSALPHFKLRSSGQVWTLYRSASEGHWLYLDTPNERFQLRETKNKALDPKTLARAHRFVEEFQKQGVETIILGYVPGGRTSYQEAQELSHSLKLPLLAPKLEGLTTCDSSHLDAASAGRFGAHFVRALSELLEDPLLKHCPPLQVPLE